MLQSCVGQGWSTSLSLTSCLHSETTQIPGRNIVMRYHLLTMTNESIYLVAGGSVAGQLGHGVHVGRVGGGGGRGEAGHAGAGRHARPDHGVSVNCYQTK